MEKKRQTYDITFKKKAVDMYIKDCMGYRSVASELGISRSMVERWVKKYKENGLEGLKDNAWQGQRSWSRETKNSPRSPRNEDKTSGS